MTTLSFHFPPLFHSAGWPVFFRASSQNECRRASRRACRRNQQIPGGRRPFLSARTPVGFKQKSHPHCAGGSGTHGIPGQIQPKRAASHRAQKLNTLASAARSIRCGPPSKTIFVKSQITDSFRFGKKLQKKPSKTIPGVPNGKVRIEDFSRVNSAVSGACCFWDQSLTHPIAPEASERTELSLPFSALCNCPSHAQL